MSRIVPPKGPLTAKIAFVGEAPGPQEEARGEPFVGPPGKELDILLSNAKISRVESFMTNVLDTCPPKNDFDLVCLKKADAALEYLARKAGLQEEYPQYPWPHTYTWPALKHGGFYLHPRYLGQLVRLKAELDSLKDCNLIVALGDTAVWALLGLVGIENSRGYVAQSIISKHKVLPAYHPARILKKWENRPILQIDLLKAKREMAFPEIRRRKRLIYLRPNFDEMEEFYQEHLVPAKYISYDIETCRPDQITCVGFAPNPDVAICIPFVDIFRPGYHYWQEQKDERRAWDFVAKCLQLPQPKLAQNGMYDFTWLWMKAGIPVHNMIEDTSHIHHALYPEMRKALGFLVSIYASEFAWKTMRGHQSYSEEKRDD